MNIERIKEELARTYAKIEKLQKKARDLEEQKKQAGRLSFGDESSGMIQGAGIGMAKNFS